jgi:hypothetical protein
MSGHCAEFRGRQVDAATRWSRAVNAFRQICIATLAGIGLNVIGAPIVAEEPSLSDRQAIEETLKRANVGFELSDPDLFASAFAEDAVYELTGQGPVFGYQKMRYSGRADIRTIIADRLERARNTDPATLSYDPASLRRYNRNTDSFIEIIDADSARHVSTWMVVMKTNVDIHISAIGRYEDELVKRDGEWLILRRVRSE